MSKNRRIPFGYMMQNGIITTNPAEVLAVLTIFSEYMVGKSLENIAINMKVPYSEDKIWNKNMVKRVLENEKYLGTDVYPQLISEEVFRKVNERKSAKATSLCIIPDELQEIRNLTVCKECGKRLFRTKAELWDCRNHGCRPFLFIGVIFEKENINTLTAQSEFILSLYSSFAQAESESISKNITLGNQMAFKEGKVRYNYKYLLGYKKGVDGKPVIIPEEAEVIQLIFKLYIDGGSKHTIAQELNNKKYPTRSKSGKWSAMLIKRILQNEKYIGDCLLQKTYTIDCISHKAVKNNGERPMYYVSDCHPAIIDKNTFNIVQQEIARRNAKRSVCTNTITEQGRYNSKYALTELLICGECGTAYRRCRWTSHNRNRTVWRCINRLEHGPKYCKSPTIDEEPLHNAIVRAINEFYNCSDDVAKVLKSATDTVLSGSNDDEIRQIEQRLKDIDQARNGFVNLIATGTCASDSLDDEFARLYSEEEKLSQKLLSLKDKANTESNELADTIKADIDNSSFELQQYDDVLVRKVVEFVKVISKEKISVTFKGGYEIKSELLT